MQEIEEVSIDFRRLLLFEATTKMTEQNRYELHLILQDIVQNVFAHIDEVIEFAVAERMRMQIK